MKTMHGMNRTVAGVIVFVCVLTQVAYPLTGETSNLDSAKKIATGVSVQQAAAAQQNAGNIIDTKNALAQATAPINPATAQTQLAPDPATGILTLPNGLQINMNPHNTGYYTYPPSVQFYASGRVMSITTIAGSTRVYDPRYGAYFMTATTIMAYEFADEDYYVTSAGRMGRLTTETSIDAWSGRDTRRSTYEYWDASDKLKTKKVYYVGGYGQPGGGGPAGGETVLLSRTEYTMAGEAYCYALTGTGTWSLVSITLTAPALARREAAAKAAREAAARREAAAKAAREAAAKAAREAARRHPW